MHSRNILVSLQRQALCAVGGMNDAPLALEHFSREVCSAQVGSCLIGTLDGGVPEQGEKKIPQEARRSIVGFR